MAKSDTLPAAPPNFFEGDAAHVHKVLTLPSAIHVARKLSRRFVLVGDVFNVTLRTAGSDLRVIVLDSMMGHYEATRQPIVEVSVLFPCAPSASPLRVLVRLQLENQMYAFGLKTVSIPTEFLWKSTDCGLMGTCEDGVRVAHALRQGGFDDEDVKSDIVESADLIYKLNELKQQLVRKVELHFKAVLRSQR